MMVCTWSPINTYFKNMSCLTVVVKSSSAAVVALPYKITKEEEVSNIGRKIYTTYFTPYLVLFSIQFTILYECKGFVVTELF